MAKEMKRRHNSSSNGSSRYYVQGLTLLIGFASKICEKDQIKYTTRKQKTVNGQENTNDTKHTVLRGKP